MLIESMQLNMPFYDTRCKNPTPCKAGSGHQGWQMWQLAAVIPPEQCIVHFYIIRHALSLNYSLLLHFLILLYRLQLLCVRCMYHVHMICYLCVILCASRLMFLSSISFVINVSFKRLHQIGNSFFVVFVMTMSIKENIKTSIC